MKKTVPLILSAIVFLSSCTVSQALETQSALSGTAETKLEVDQFFLDLLEDFSDFESKSGYSIMDEAMLNLTDRINSSYRRQQQEICNLLRLLKPGEAGI